jgi:hypothetical protein
MINLKNFNFVFSNLPLLDSTELIYLTESGGCSNLFLLRFEFAMAVVRMFLDGVIFPLSFDLYSFISGLSNNSDRFGLTEL